MIYLDTSALVARFTVDQHSAAANTILAETIETVSVSDFSIAEFTAVAMATRRSGATGYAATRRLFDSLDGWMERQVQFVEIAPSDMADCTRLLRDFDLVLRAPDTLHLAICARLGAALLTFDHRQADAALAIGLTLVPRP